MMNNMIVLLNEFGRWLVMHLGRMSMELALLTGIVLALVYLLRVKSPALRYMFWGLLLAKPVITLLVASPLSFYGPLSPVVPEVFSTPQSFSIVMEKEMEAVVTQPETIPSESVPTPQPAIPSLWRQVDGYGWTGIVWATLAILMGLRLLLGYAYVNFLKSTAQVQREGMLADILEEVHRAMRIKRRIRIATTNVCHGPVLAGAFSPVILLPENMAVALSSRQLKLVITHELAHAKRWDNLVLLMQRLAEMFFFFHPVVWFCGWMMRREAEAACDDMVMSVWDRTEGLNAVAYADSLTCVAEMKCGITHRLLVNTFAAAESNFKRRIMRILNEPRTHMTLWVSATACIGLVVIGIFGLPTVLSAPQDNVAQSDAASSADKNAAAIDEPSVEVPELTPVNNLKESAFTNNKIVVLAIDSENGLAKANIGWKYYREWHAQGDKDRPERYYIEAIDVENKTVKVTKIDYYDENRKPVLSEKNSAWLPLWAGFTHLATVEPADGYTPKSYWDLVAVIRDIQSPRTGFFRSEERSGKLTCTICTDNPEQLRQAIENTAKLKWIGAVPLTEDMFIDHFDQRSKSLDIETTLDAPVTLKVSKTDSVPLLSGIASFISKYYQINIVIDKRAFAPTDNGAADPHAPGPEAGPVWFHCKNMPIRDVLNEILPDQNLTYTVEPSLIWISTPDLLEADAGQLRPNLETASAHLKNALASPVSIEFLDIHIQKLMEFISDSWDINIVVDSEVVCPPRDATTNAVWDSLKYTTDGMISCIKLHDVTLTEAIQSISRMLNLSFKVEDDVVWISSYEKITTQ
jgi:beta-lactamase regulating signal transducer with metallopeptidase domain